MDQRGFLLPLALLLCLALGFIAVASATLAVTDSRIASNFDASLRALYVAEAGLELGVERVAAAYEEGVALVDTAHVVDGETLNGFRYSVVAVKRREPPAADLNGNGIRGEVVRYDRAWGYSGASASGGQADPGEPVRILTSQARSDRAMEELALEIGLERDAAVLDPHGRGAWRIVRLRWSSYVGHR